MNTNHKPQSQTRSVCNRSVAVDQQERIKTLVRYGAIMAALLIAFCAGHAAELPRPGEAIDAGDSYRLKDGSRVLLHRVLHEVAIKHLNSKSAEPTLREASVNQDPLAPLVTIEGGRSNIVDLYQVEDSQAVDRLLTVQETEIAGFPVLMHPASRRRMIATDEIIVQFAEGTSTPQATALLTQEGLDALVGPVPSAPSQYLVRIAAGLDRNALTRAGQVAARQGVEWAQPNFFCELEFCFIPNDTAFGKQQYLRNTGQNGAVDGADIRAENTWDITTGKPEVVIAIIDTGVDIDHPELDFTMGKIFINPNEFGNGRDTNGIDDDGNGYIDDWRGWDFYSLDNNPRPGLIPNNPDTAHGTSCAGIAAAQGNDGQGIAGVAYGSKILPIKISADNGTGFPNDFNLGRAIRYAADYADVLSSSWAMPDATAAIISAIDYAAASGRNGKGAPPLFASGNSAATWWVQRFPVNVSSGTYRFSFYYKNMSNNDQFVALDNIALLGADEYTYTDTFTEPFFPRVDFETGMIPPGWSVEKGGGASQDWSVTSSVFDPFHGTPSTWCLKSPDPAQVPLGGWVEFRSPEMALNGSYWLRFARLSGMAFGSVYEARLLNTQGQVVQTLGSMDPGLITIDRYVRFPASHGNSIAIGAVTDNDRYANYSCYYPPFNPTVTGLFCVAPSNEGWNDITTLDIAGAPGQNPGNARFGFGGTSAATPCAAGVAALILSKNSELTLQQLKDAIQNGCVKIGDEEYVDGKAVHYGYGRINAHNSVAVYTATDGTAPVVSSVVTRTGRQVEVTFSEKMGSGVTTPANYTITGTGKGTLAANPSSVRWVSGNKFLLEWTAGEMIAGTGNITIVVNSVVKDVAGNNMGNPSFANANGSRVIHAISCGLVLSNATDPLYPFESQRNYWSGVGFKSSMGINSIINNDGTPVAVYKTDRNISLSQSYPGDIVHTLPNITAGLNHTVRLYLANNGTSIHSGDVVFDIYINDILKESNFDLIFQAAGISNVGLWRDYPNITPNGSGQIVVKVVPKMSYNQTWPGYFYNATLGGIKVTAQ